MPISEERFESWRADIHAILLKLIERTLSDGTAINILVSEVAALKGSDGKEIQARIDSRVMDYEIRRQQTDQGFLQELRRLLEDDPGNGSST